MRFLFLLLLFIPFTLSAQTIEKPEYVIITNGEIITKAQLEQYGKDGYIKAMNKGVSQEKRDELAELLGEEVGEREFIIQIDLYTEAELAERKQKKKVKAVPMKAKAIPDSLTLNVGDTIIDFSVLMTDGREVRLSELKGKVVLLNFWAVWCAPCLIEFHEIPGKILNRFAGEDFAFLPVSRGDKLEAVSNKMAQLKEKGIDFPAGVDPEFTVWKDNIPRSIPRNFVIDRQGVIRYISFGNGEGSVDKLAEEIDRMLRGK